MKRGLKVSLVVIHCPNHSIHSMKRGLKALIKYISISAPIVTDSMKRGLKDRQFFVVDYDFPPHLDEKRIESIMPL